MGLFSKSQNEREKPDALSYELSDGLRNQIYQLWERGFGPDDKYSPGPSKAYEEIYQTLCYEHQLQFLPCVTHHPTHHIAIVEYFLNLKDVSKTLDVVQVVFNTMERLVHRFRNAWNHDIFMLAPSTADTVNELNRLFEENNVGYRYIDGSIVKIPNGPPPLPLKERLIADEPATNLRKIKEMIGGATVVAVHDPYIATASLVTMITLADMGTAFIPSLRILGTTKPFTKTTEKQSFLTLLANIHTERNASWEARVYSVTSAKPHRRFLILHDGSIVTCGMSLNHIAKDETLDHEQAASENARHDINLFEQEWKIATPV